MSELMPTPGQARQDALNAIAESLAVLAARVRSRATASNDFARLTERAREISAQAWEVQTSRWGFTENAGRLADALVTFANEAAAACARARAETDGNMAMVHALLAQSGRIAELGRQVDAGHDEVRAAMEPLEALLTAMQADGQPVEGSLAADAAALAKRAMALSDYALGLRGGGRQAGEAAAAIAKAMGVIIDEATVISSRMTSASSGFNDAVIRMASGTRDVERRYVDRVTGVVWS